MPTKERALKINQVILSLSQFLKIQTRCCVGGNDPKEERNALKNGGIQIAVGTPGRIKDLMSRQAISSGHLSIVVVDHADEMLGRGYIDDVREIF